MDISGIFVIQNTTTMICKALTSLLLALLLFLNATAQWPIHTEAETTAASFGVSIIPGSEGTTAIGMMDNNDWIELDFTLPRDSVYKVTVRAAGQGEIWFADSVFNIIGRAYLEPTLTEQTYTSLVSYLWLKAGTSRSLRIIARKCEALSIDWVEVDRSPLFLVNNYESNWRWMDGQRGNVPWKAVRIDSLNNGWIKQTARPTSLTLSNLYHQNPKTFGVFGGRRYRFPSMTSMCFNLAKSDTLTWPFCRAEIYQPPWTHLEYWYGFSFMSPTDVTGDANRHIIQQWHGTDDPGEDARSPNLAFEVDAGRLVCKIVWASTAIQDDGNDDKDGELVYDLGPYIPGVWFDFVVHAKFDYDNDGVLEVWVNNTKLVNRQNLPNWYNDQNPPYFKIGIYKWGWQGGRLVGGVWTQWADQTPYHVLTCYYDNLRIAGPTGTKDLVDPALANQ